MSSQQVPGWLCSECCAEQQQNRSRAGVSHGVCSRQWVGAVRNQPLIAGKQQWELFQPFSWSALDQNNRHQLLFHTWGEWKSWDLARASMPACVPQAVLCIPAQQSHTGMQTGEAAACWGSARQQQWAKPPLELRCKLQLGQPRVCTQDEQPWPCQSSAGTAQGKQGLQQGAART